MAKKNKKNTKVEKEEKKGTPFLSILGIAFLVILGLLLGILLGTIAFRALTRAVVANIVPVSEPIANVPQEVQPVVNEGSETTFIGSPDACGYTDEMLSLDNPDRGIILEQTSVINGPAIVQPDGMNFISVFPGASVEAQPGNVVWLYTGDLDCLQSMYQFFPNKTLTEITN